MPEQLAAFQASERETGALPPTPRRGQGLAPDPAVG